MNKIKKVEKTKQITDSLLQVSKSVKTENLGERVIEKKDSLGLPSYVAVYGIIALLCVALLGCPPSSNSTDSTDPVVDMFPYICPNGTAKPGMTTTDNSISCTACTSPAVGTECMLPVVDMFPYICPNGTAKPGMTTTDNNISCTACNASYTEVGTECIRMFSYTCPNGSAKSGMTTMENQISCVSCDDDEGFHLKSEQCLTFDGTFTRVGSQTSFGVGEVTPVGLASIDDTLYMVGSTHDFLYRLVLEGTNAGEAIRIGSTFTSSERRPQGLASITDNDGTTTLYMVGMITPALFTVDITAGTIARVAGGVTSFGDVAETMPRGLASIGGILYMIGDNDNNETLYKIEDPSSGIAVSVSDPPPPASFGAVNEGMPYGLASIDNTLYMVGQANRALYRVNTSTGVATQVGSATNFGIAGSNAIPTGLASIGQTLYMVDDRAGVDGNVLLKAELPDPPTP